jgi:hypothetical protein
MAMVLTAAPVRTQPSPGVDDASAGLVKFHAPEVVFGTGSLS